MKSTPARYSRSSPVPGRPRRLWRSFLLAVGVVIGAVLATIYAPGLWRKAAKDSPPKVAPKKQEQAEPAEKQGSASPAATSPYKNTRPEVKYVGTKACIACHEDQHQTFGKTGMARSMAEIDLSREPPDASFVHAPSQSRYEVRRRDGKMWHREFHVANGGEEILLQEYPVKYVTGSGRHSLTYLVEDDGFLMESPITWYTSRQAWGMSPGYDRERHSGFQREVGETCLVCHAGSVKAEGKSLHRMTVTEAAIGCEQCHGPGELHVARYQNARLPAAAADGEIDDTIVNPSKLPRDLSEAVCQQCHLRGNATVIGKGKTPFDFRPGLPLAAYHLDFELDTPDGQMSVVGHVGQMHQSKCFQNDQSFSCLTCHGPHGDAEGAALQQHYVQVCTSCHAAGSCHVKKEERARRSPDNDCVVCHMPRTATDIPHLSFTHHRVAVHPEGAPVGVPASAGTRLQPAIDVTSLPPAELQRSLGLAYLELANKEDQASRREAFRREAMGILSQVRASGERDGTVDSWLARLRFELGMPDAPLYAQSALDDPHLAGQDLCNALFILADAQFKQQRYRDAIATLEKLAKLRRHSLQWLLMAECQKAVGNEQAMEEALQKAVHINPRLGEIHGKLAAFYQSRGNEQRARFHALRKGL